MDQSWAQPALQWLLTPALIVAALLGLAQLYDAPTRWSRKLKSDLTITGGLPEGTEKRLWQESVDWQATRLREYRRAFVGWTLFWKWAGLAFLGVAIFGLVLFPPINKPGDRYPYGPTDYGFMAMGLLWSIVYAVSIGSGRDFFGRSPRDLILLQRWRRNKVRRRKLGRIETERERRAASDTEINPKGSRLGFSTQVDEFGEWMRDSALRGMVRMAGFISADLRARYYADLLKRDGTVPPWPKPK